MSADTSTADGTHLPTRRLRELTVRRARLRRRVEVAGNPTHLGGLDTEISRLGDEIDHRRDHLAIAASTGSYQPWTHHHFDLGDFARIGGAWYPVLRVGWRALTVPPLELLGERRDHPNPEHGVDADEVAYVRVLRAPPSRPDAAHPAPARGHDMHLPRHHPHLQRGVRTRAGHARLGVTLDPAHLPEPDGPRATDAQRSRS